MKLLIDETLVLKHTYAEDADELELLENNEALDDLEKMLKSFSVWYNLKRTDNGYTLEIGAQKCTLDEQSMNTLFYDILFDIPHVLKYSPLGGTGCDLHSA